MSETQDFTPAAPVAELPLEQAVAQPAVEDITPILEERAAALARSSDDEETSGETIGMVVLVVGEERYGVDVQDVQEIEPLDKITPIPGTPAFWSGVVNLRGSMYPVLDIERYLGLPASAEVENPKVALVSRGGLSVGLLVDEVAEIRKVRSSEIGPPVADGLSKAEVVRGVTPDMLSVLDLEALLADPTLVVEDGAA
ncbi:MAG TPA: chemotaxis protein CheW [Thermoleophilaceae bacterium]|jgi:purine-binding chemotaxis protein CheW